MLPRSADAEEAAQEALLRAWRQRHQCAEPASPEPWVAQIARREALRLVAGKHRREISVDTVEPVLDHRQRQPEDQERTLHTLWLGQALEAFEPRDRALAVLHYRGDLSQVQLARALGLPESTIRVRLHRLRRRLRAGLHDAEA